MSKRSRKEVKDDLLGDMANQARKDGKQPDLRELDKDLTKIFELNDLRKAQKRYRVETLTPKVAENDAFVFRKVDAGPTMQRLTQRLKRMFKDPYFQVEIIKYSAMSSGQLGAEKKAIAEAHYRKLIRESNAKWGDWRNEPLLPIVDI